MGSPESPLGLALLCDRNTDPTPGSDACSLCEREQVLGTLWASVSSLAEQDSRAASQGDGAVPVTWAPITVGFLSRRPFLFLASKEQREWPLTPSGMVTPQPSLPLRSVSGSGTVPCPQQREGLVTATVRELPPPRAAVGPCAAVTARRGYDSVPTPTPPHPATTVARHACERRRLQELPSRASPPEDRWVGFLA